MRRQTANQTLKRLAKDLASHPFLLLLAFLGTIVQVALSIYLPTYIDWTGHRPSPSDWLFTSFLADFSPNDLGGHRKYPCAVGQSSSL